MQFYALTDRGKSRLNNEDCCFAENFDNKTVLIIADGMGGHKAGEIASSKAIDAVSSLLRENLSKPLLPGQIIMCLSDAVKKANEQIYLLAEKNVDLEGMGTTLECCVIQNNTLYMAHIGDSRVYLLSGKGNIKRLTKDHSLVEYMIENGTITKEEAKTHPQKNVITRALGIKTECDVDISQVKLGKDDKLLICTDGLTNMVDEEDIKTVMMQSSSPKECADTLIKLANEAGGTDNISVIIAYMEGIK